MVKKLNKLKKSHAQFADTVKESAQQIWLAGLGAFAKAQQEGSKVFESLVQDGLQMQRKTQAAAEEKFSEATERAAHLASDLGHKAQGQWDKLENIFEDRVAKALARLGIPSAQDLQALHDRIEALELSLAKATKPAARSVARPAPAASPASAKSAPAPAAGKRSRSTPKAPRTRTSTAPEGSSPRTRGTASRAGAPRARAPRPPRAQSSDQA